ncbi:MAG: DNA glycosylase [Bacillota bacterium]|nr:DNA glycosylase [Bacillota bacterium]MDW7676681.1 DNA glycosylase [Bacillota bacterium]
MMMQMIDRQTAALTVNTFHLGKTLQSGQCFRWKRGKDGSFTGVAKGRILNVRQKSDTLMLHPVTLEEVKNLWIPYFDLDRDYEAFNRYILQQAPWMTAPLHAGRGLRLLRQDPWETAITFIFSANNHIPRITASIDCLSRTYGPMIGKYKGVLYHDFPGVELLMRLTAEEWRACGAGYRSRYLMKMVQQWEACYDQVKRNGLERPNEHAVRCLLETLPGIGPKVSACISLFGLGYQSQFPVDVWVRRRIKELWPHAPALDRDIEQAALSLFGEAAGYAQQLIFYEARQRRASTS